MQRYLLAQVVQPFSATLLVVLPALLLERLLRLFDLVADRGVPGTAVVRMLADLVPFYMGLALPAALFASIVIVIGRLSAGSELDAMQGAGLSLRFISLPFVAVGATAALIGFGLYAYAQPVARYAYRAAFQAAVEGAWNATIPPGEITRISDSLVLTADAQAQDGTLHGITIWQLKPDGSEQVTTARTGTLALSPDGTQLMLTVAGATQLQTLADGTVDTANAADAAQHRPFLLPIRPFRARGLDEREMTLRELWNAGTIPSISHRTITGELHARLVRSLSLVLVPVLAVPFGLAAKRTARPYGMVAGIVLLVLYFHAVQLAQSVGATGRADPRPLLWGLFAVYAVSCCVIFLRAERHTTESPLDPLIDALDRLATAVTRSAILLRRRTA